MGAQIALLDANGDGHADLAVGAPNYSTGVTVTNLGRVQLFLGTNGVFSTNPVWSVVGEKPGTMLGQPVRSLGDLDRDGRAELGMGAGGSAPTSIFRGTSEGLSRTSSWTLLAPGGADSSRDQIRGVGDVNGDGWSDVSEWRNRPRPEVIRLFPRFHRWRLCFRTGGLGRLRQQWCLEQWRSGWAGRVFEPQRSVPCGPNVNASRAICTMDWDLVSIGCNG